jgi:hypothetical protein
MSLGAEEFGNLWARRLGVVGRERDVVGGGAGREQEAHRFEPVGGWDVLGHDVSFTGPAVRVPGSNGSSER